MTNDSGFITSSALTGYATETWVGEQGYQTASDVSSAIASQVPTNYVTTDTTQDITGKKTIHNQMIFNFDNDHFIKLDPGYEGSAGATTGPEGAIVTVEDDYYNAKLSTRSLIFKDASDGAKGTGYFNGCITYKPDDISQWYQFDLPKQNGTLALISDISRIASNAASTAISSQTKETWTFTLADGSTVTKSVVLG